MANFAALLAAYAAARRGVARGNGVLQVLPLGAAALLGAATLALGAREVAHLGDFDSFWRGEAELVALRPAAWVGLSTYAAAAALLLWARQRYAGRDPQFF